MYVSFFRCKGEQKREISECNNVIMKMKNDESWNLSDPRMTKRVKPVAMFVRVINSGI